MPCYRCGTRQADPEAGKSSPWRRGVVSEHQVLICPSCVSTALPDLSRCARCGSAHLIRRLDQVECLDCRLIRDAEPESPSQPPLPSPPPLPAARPPGPGTPPAPGTPVDLGTPGTPGRPSTPGTDLAAEVARALEKVLGRR